VFKRRNSSSSKEHKVGRTHRYRITVTVVGSHAPAHGRDLAFSSGSVAIDTRVIRSKPVPLQYRNRHTKESSLVGGGRSGWNACSRRSDNEPCKLVSAHGSCSDTWSLLAWLVWLEHCPRAAICYNHASYVGRTPSKARRFRKRRGQRSPLLCIVVTGLRVYAHNSSLVTRKRSAYWLVISFVGHPTLRLFGIRPCGLQGYASREREAEREIAGQVRCSKFHHREAGPRVREMPEDNTTAVFDAHRFWRTGM